MQEFTLKTSLSNVVELVRQSKQVCNTYKVRCNVHHFKEYVHVELLSDVNISYQLFQAIIADISFVAQCDDFLVCGIIAVFE